MKMDNSLELSPHDELRPEYDFRSLKGVVRGKYAGRSGEQVRIVHLDADIADAFTDEAAINAALRQYLKDHGSTSAKSPPIQAP
jgi:hypothetical protein